jgi:hypothetical protein
MIFFSVRSARLLIIIFAQVFLLKSNLFQSCVV